MDQENRPYFSPLLATLIMAMVADFKNENLPQCAIEVQNLSRVLLRSASGKPNDIEFHRLLDKFLEGSKEITRKYNIDIEWGKDYSLPLGYLASWFKRWYWD